MLTTQYFYFFQTVKEQGRPRLKPLPGQTTPVGEPIEPSYNVQADSIMRGSYPIGTVFVSETIELRTHSTVPFYSAGAIYPILQNLGGYIVQSHIPSSEMRKAYEDYTKTMTTAKTQSTTLFDLAEESPEESSVLPTPPSKTLREEINTDKKYAKPTISNDGFYVSDENWELLIRNIKQNINTMMIGPSGTGKTELVLLACKKLGVDCSVYDMGSMYDPVAGLLGVHRLQQGGVSVFDYAKFTQDIQKPGVVLLDELSRAPVTTNNILFPCLDSRRTLPVEMAGGDGLRSVAIHPDCVFIATANIGVEYTGTMSLDRALVGRFFPLELDYMPSTEEARVLSKRYHIPASAAANLVAVAETVRNLYNKGEISCTISTRETLQAAQLIADGWSTLAAMELTYLPLFEGSRTDGERSIVSKIFMTR